MDTITPTIEQVTTEPVPSESHDTMITIRIKYLKFNIYCLSTNINRNQGADTAFYFKSKKWLKEKILHFMKVQNI